jgi:hypothetical protein
MRQGLNVRMLSRWVSWWALWPSSAAPSDLKWRRPVLAPPVLAPPSPRRNPAQQLQAWVQLPV